MGRVDNKQAHLARYAAMGVGKDPRTAAFDMVGGGDYEQVGLIERFMLDAFAPVPEGGLLIDIGCGPGRLSRYLADRKGLRYLGTDVVPELLDVARQECQREDWSFLEVNGFQIPADDGLADVVAIFSVFTNIYPEQACLLVQEAYRVLKPGGRLLTTYFDITTQQHRRVFADLVKHQDLRIDPLVFLHEEFLKVFAEMAGFEYLRFLRPDQAVAEIPSGSLLKDGRSSLAGPCGLGQALCLMAKPQ